MSLDPLLLRPAELEFVVEDDDNDLLYAPAAVIETLLPDFDPWDEFALVEGLLSKKYDEKKHPRWPKGTPRAGQFMKKGQWFQSGGKTWQVISTSGGEIEAVEASGLAAKVEHRKFIPQFDAVDGPGVGVPGIEEAPPKKMTKMESPVVSPYVDSASHDPSIGLPSSSPLSAEQWERFGREDQLYYVELQDRFGKWKASAVSGHDGVMSQVHAEYESSIQSLFHQAFQGNKGSSGFWGTESSTTDAGNWLNLAFLVNQVNDPATIKKAWARYEKAKVAFDELSEVTHWDLYNRTKAPDVVLFHGGGSNAPGAHYKNDFLTGKVPIYAGFSQSYSLSGGESWGSTVIATPTAVRHVAMSYYAPLPQSASSWSEKEIAVGVRMKLDDRSVVFHASSYGTTGAASGQIADWLHKESSSAPIGGQFIDDLKDIWAGKGAIPVPPAPANIQAVGAGNKQYAELPPATGQEAVAMVKGLKYKSEDGTKESALGQINGMGLQPGDFIEGKKGTRYVVIADPADSAAGLRYVKVMNSAGVVLSAPAYEPGSYMFANSDMEFYRLDGHVDVPKPKAVAGFAPFTAEQYSQLAQGEKKQLGDFGTGEMLTHEGTGYKVVSHAPGSTTHLESLDSGKKFTANTAYKAVPLVPKEGFVAPVDPNAFKPAKGDVVLVSGHGGATFIGRVGEPNSLKPELVNVAHPGLGGEALAVDPQFMEPFENPSPDMAEVGDIFSSGGTKFTVTSILKNGTVRAKPAGGGKGEKFSKVEVMEKLDTGQVFRPGDWEIGDKQKAKSLPVGTVISGSGVKVRPYVVVAGGPESKQVMLQNLETGEVTSTTPNKSWPVLSKADLSPVEPHSAVPPKPETTVEYQQGPTVMASDLVVGNTVSIHGNVYEVDSVPDKGMVALTHLGRWDAGEFFPGELGMGWKKLTGIPKSFSTGMVLLEPKGSGFNIDQYVDGESVTFKDMEIGTVFKTANGNPLVLKEKNDNTTLSLNLNTGKNVSGVASSSHKYVTLVPKAESPKPLEYGQAVPGDKILLGKLQPGDQYSVMEGLAPVEIVSLNPNPKGHPTITPVNGTTYSIATDSPDNEVVLVKKKDGAPTPVKSPGPPATLDAEADGGYDSYLHPKSGKYKYPRLSTFSPGTFFTDKSGKKWLVVSNDDASPVITDPDGGLFSANGALRGKVSDEALFVDVSQAEAEPSFIDPFTQVVPKTTGTDPGSVTLPSGNTMPLKDWVETLEFAAGDELLNAPAAETVTKWVGALNGDELVAAAKYVESLPGVNSLAAKIAIAQQGTDVDAPGGVVDLNDEPLSMGDKSWVAVALQGAGKPDLSKAVAMGGADLSMQDMADTLGFWLNDHPEDHPMHKNVMKGYEALLANGYQHSYEPSGADQFAASPASPRALTPTGEKMPVNQLPDWAVALTDDGKLFYKAGQGVANDYELASSTLADVGPEVMVEPMKPPDVDLNEMEETGATKVVSELQPGDVFKAGASRFVLLHVSDEGSAALRLDGKGMVFTPKDSEIWSKDVQMFGPKKAQPKHGDVLPAGTVTDVNMKHPDGPQVEIGGDNNWMSVANAQNPLGELQDAVDSEQMDDLPAGTVVENGVVTYKKTGEGADAGWENTDTGAIEYGPTGFWNVVKLGKQPNVGVVAAPAAGTQVKITHTNQFEVGDTYDVPEHGITWKVLSSTEYGASLEMIASTQGNGQVGAVSDVDGPIDVTVTRPNPGAAYESPTTFEQIATSAYFDAHDAVWQKLSSHKAEIVAPYGAQMGDAGLVTEFGPADDVFAYGSEAPPVAGDLEVGDKIESFGQLNVGDKYSLVGMGSTHTVTAKDANGVTVESGGYDIETYALDHQFAGDGAKLVEKGSGKPPVAGYNSFYENLANGDQAMYSHGGGLMIVTVTDNQIGGLGIKVKDNFGTEFVADEASLSPMPEDEYSEDEYSELEPELEPEDPLVPYLHPKSGKYKYDPVGALGSGTKFTDKAKGQYVVIGHVGDQTLFEDASGNQFSTSSKSRVKALGLSEAAGRVVYLTGGGVRLVGVG